MVIIAGVIAGEYINTAGAGTWERPEALQLWKRSGVGVALCCHIAADLRVGVAIAMEC